MIIPLSSLPCAGLPEASIIIQETKKAVSDQKIADTAFFTTRNYSFSVKNPILRRYPLQVYFSDVSFFFPTTTIAPSVVMDNTAIAA